MIQTPPFTSRFIQGAALVLLRENKGLEILLIQRHSQLKAYPDAWAFPGGKQDPEDQGIEDTALRELFEETALYLTAKPVSLEQRQHWQKALNSGQVSWQTLRKELGYADKSTYSMTAMGWRITPPIYPARFEAAYYYAAYPHDHEPLISAEAQQARWWKPADLIAWWAQGKALVPPPVLNVLQTLVGVSFPLDSGVHERLYAYHHSREHLPLPITLYPGVELVPLRTPTLLPATHTNTYFVGAKDFVIIDPASPYPQEQAVLIAEVDRRLAQGHQAQAVLLTHHHQDHIGAAAVLQDRFQIPVMAHALTQHRLTQQAYPLTLDHTIENGDTWVLSDEHSPLQLEALHTPGHAPGHLCFIENQHKLGFVGDMIAGIGSIVIQHPAHSTDPDGHMQSYLESLQKLVDLDLKRAFPAHGPMVTTPTKTFEDYIHHRLQREAHIEHALLQGSPQGEGLTLAELRTAVYPDLDISLISFAEDSLRAHLVKMQHDQRVTQSPQGFYIHKKNIE